MEDDAQGGAVRWSNKIHILRGESLAIYFGDSQFSSIVVEIGVLIS